MLDQDVCVIIADSQSAIDFALENNVWLRREIFFSASITEETTVESTTPDIVGSEVGLLVGKVVRAYWMRSNKGMSPFDPRLMYP